mgnify:CR=1 FL=1
MINVEKAAEEALVIIRGYAISRCNEGFRVLNLNDGEGAAIMSPDGTLIETNMDDILLRVRYHKPAVYGT